MNASVTPSAWTCPACCAGSGKHYRYPPGPFVYCASCGRAMRAAEQIAAALARMIDGGELAADLRRLRDAIEPNAPRQRARRAAAGVELLSLRQVDALLGKRRGTAAELLQLGKLAAVQVGSRLRVARAELERMLATGVPVAVADEVRPPRRRSTSVIGARRAAAIRALRVVSRP